ncbi:MAG: AmmeMemoRadiSam system radical SAM enzyme [Bradyrhizobium sp.]|nr:MAG: AmmeMemoRadiSam system radical SAM enzyme [Bradyrhizobium sp.]
MRFVEHFTRPLADGRVLCEVCPRVCDIAPGAYGACYSRRNVDGRMALTSDGLAADLRVEPIELTPLYHFLPGSAALTLGTAGCNLACAFCGAHDAAVSRATEARSKSASPAAIARAAIAHGCASVAFADNDPAVYFESAIDIAAACRAQGIKTVAKTAGYLSPGPREALFGAVDAANVDLKAFSEGFYWRRTGGHFDAVLETLQYIRRESDVWLEITTMLIAGENDSEREIDALTGWIVEELGDETPLHFTALRPDHQMRTHPPTPQATLTRARAQAKANGLRHVYVVGEAASFCAGCGATVIRRDGDRVSDYALDGEGACHACGRMLAGQFASTRGGYDGARAPVDIEAYA